METWSPNDFSQPVRRQNRHAAQIRTHLDWTSLICPWFTPCLWFFPSTLFCLLKPCWGSSLWLLTSVYQPDWISPSFLLLFMLFPPPSPSPALPPCLWPVVGLSVLCSPTVGLGWLSTLLLITPQQSPIYLAVKWNRGGERPVDIMVIHLTTAKA